MRQVFRGAVLLLLLMIVVPAPAHAQQEQPPLVRVGTEGTYPPFSFHDPQTQELTGYDVEVVKAIGAKAGWRLEFVETQWDAIFPALDAQRIDLVANQVSRNPERAAKYGLSSTYTYSRGVIVRRTGDDRIKSIADLSGKTTAQSSTSNWAKVARDAGARVEAVEGFAQAAALLQQGRVDAIVNDNIAVLDYLATTGSKDVEIAGDAGQAGSEQVLALRQADAALLSRANQAIDALKADGTLRGISQKYFKADVSVQNGGAADLSEGRGPRSTLDILRSTAWPMFVGLIKVTIPLTALSFAIGLVLALLVALARISPYRLLSGLARAFISVIRGTPLLLQLFIVFYGLPQIGLKFPPFTAAVVAFSLNVAGYAAEVIRSAILSVPRGQFEAASTIGFGYAQTLRRIVLPQAARTDLAAAGNKVGVSALNELHLDVQSLWEQHFNARVAGVDDAGKMQGLIDQVLLEAGQCCEPEGSKLRPAHRKGVVHRLVEDACRRDTALALHRGLPSNPAAPSAAEHEVSPHRAVDPWVIAVTVRRSRSSFPESGTGRSGRTPGSHDAESIELALNPPKRSLR